MTHGYNYNCIHLVHVILLVGVYIHDYMILGLAAFCIAICTYILGLITYLFMIYYCAIALIGLHTLAYSCILLHTLAYSCIFLHAVYVLFSRVYVNLFPFLCVGCVTVKLFVLLLVCTVGSPSSP